jgi:hypothetical protein
MKSRTSSLLRFLLVIAICCSTIGIAHANNTVPLLSGTFSVNTEDASPGPNPIYLDSWGSMNIQGWISVPFNQDYPSCDPPLGGLCSLSYSGNLSGTVFMDVSFDSGPDITLTAPASGTFSGTFTAGCLPDCSPLNYVSETIETDTVTFAGHWSNGMKSIGEVDGYFDFGCAEGCGGIAIVGGRIHTVAAPEPSSVLLFGSGVLGFAGMLRRKFLN